MSDESSKPRTPEELVAAIREQASLEPLVSVDILEMAARLSRIAGHATRLATLLAERDAAAADATALLEAIIAYYDGNEVSANTIREEWLPQARTVVASARSGAPRPDVLGALIELLAMVDQSEGVVGWHLNGATAPWSEFDFIEQLREAAAARGGAA